MLLLKLTFLAICLVAIECNCPPCTEIKCEPLERKCFAGLVTDKCGCCQVCGVLENEECYHPNSENADSQKWLGRCGKKLRCQLSEPREGIKQIATCVCQDGQDYCGSDNVSYTSLCGLLEQGLRNGTRISIKRKGPCDAAPVITHLPESLSAFLNDEISLVCEAQGFPIPKITWVYRRVDGKEFNLPNDDSKISVNIRGGPEKWQKTGWAQISKVDKRHEGDYKCIASNVFGSVVASARIKIMS